MAAFVCPDCGSSNLFDAYDDCMECEDCGKISYVDECLVKAQKSKLPDKIHFDDGSGNFPRDKKPNHRENSTKIGLDNFERLYDED